MPKQLFAVLFTFGVLLAHAPVALAQDANTHQVYEAVQAGRLSEAQSMMDKVLRDHPDSAKAHYVEAELLAKEGRYPQAREELRTAERLAPGLPFAKSQAVEELTNLTNPTLAAVRQSRAPFPVNQSPSFPWGLLIVVIAIVAGVFLILRAVTRSRRISPQNMLAPSAYAPGSPVQPYGPAGGMPGGFGGGGMGSGILGGLATGAAVGVGAVAAEELIHHFTNHPGAGSGFVPSPAVPDAVPFDDLGGQDFGISDSSTWDDAGSSGDFSSGGDWG